MTLPHKTAPTLKSAVLFTALALGFALVYWLLIVLAQQHRLPFAMGRFDFSMEGNSVPGIVLVCVLRVFGPAVAAILALLIVRDRTGLAELWRSATRWRVPARWYVLAVLGPLAVSAVLVAFGIGMELLQFAPEQIRPLRFAMFFVLMIVFDGPLGEELGWRGLLLPALLRKTDPVKASLIVGIVWYAWHIPLYLADGKALHPLGYFVNILATSILFTWFYLRSRCSTFFMIFLHATTNFALFLVVKSFTHPDDIQALQIVYDIVLAAAAICAAAAMRPMRRAANA